MECTNFEIDDGVLLKYLREDTTVSILTSIIKIDKNAFQGCKKRMPLFGLKITRY